jgi:hypothetical protein
MRRAGVIFLSALLAAGCRPPTPNQNQRTPSTSPSGKYVLTVPIERDPNDRNIPLWRVTISDTNGTQLYRDNSKFIGTLSVYWCWDNADRVWLYNSDDGRTYVWQSVDGQWLRSPPAAFGALTAPTELYPDYVKMKK